MKNSHFMRRHPCLVPFPSYCRSTKPSSTSRLWLLGPPQFRLYPGAPFGVLTFSFYDPYKSFPSQSVPARACPRQGIRRQGLVPPLSYQHLKRFFGQVALRELFEGWPILFVEVTKVIEVSSGAKHLLAPPIFPGIQLRFCGEGGDLVDCYSCW